MKTLKRILFFIAGIYLLIGCSKSDQFSGDDLNEVNLNKMNPKSLINEMNPKGFVAVNDEVCLEGTSNFDVYAPKEGRVVVSPDEMFLIMEATLTHVEGQNYLLKTTETMPPPMGPFLYRKIEWDVKISAGGVVKFSWPETWWELGETHQDVLGQMLTHTGCIFTGPGINKGTIDYNGYFDGVNFYAAMHLTGQQVQEPLMDVYAGIIGPVKFVVSMTLSKVACIETK